MNAGPTQPDPLRPAPPEGGPSRQGFLTRTALYPQLYTWFVFLAAMDLLLTWLILRADGQEVNLIADWVIRNYDLPGVVVFKFLIVMLVVTICEIVGRISDALGRKLARWAVVLTAFPVVIGFVHLVRLSAELQRGM